jgi:translation initiation factor 2 alpha subunit (eIF-2alpha)
MRVQIDVITYEKDRLDFFTALMKKAQKKYDRLYKRFENSPYLSEGAELLNNAGRELQFFEEIVEMLKQKLKES